MTTKHLTPRVLKAALGLTEVDAQQMCDITGIHKNTISKFKNGHNKALGPEISTTIERFFNNRDIELLENGVKEFDEITPIYGSDGFQRLYDRIYDKIKEGGELCILNGVAKHFVELLGDEYLKGHIQRMMNIKDKVKIRAIVQKHDTIFFGRDYADYRWLEEEYFPETTKFIFDKYVAYINMRGDETRGRIYKIEDIAKAERKTFNALWEKAANEF